MVAKKKFNKQKIMNAAKKAFIAVDGTLTKAGVKKIRRIGSEIEKVATKTQYPLSSGTNSRHGRRTTNGNR